MSDFIQRIRERKVFQVLLVYLGVGWALTEVSEFVVDNYGLSPNFLNLTVFFIVIGLPVALVLAWFHGEKGHQRVQKVEAVILASLLVVAVVGSIRIASRSLVPTVTADEVFVDLGDASVAVLPFDNRLRDPDLDWLGTGTSELLTTGLAQVASLRVVSGQRLFDLARQEGVEDPSHIPDALASRIALRSGAHYMVEGSILGSGTDITITASLINLQDGGVVAAAKARGSDVFALVDSIMVDLASQIVGAVGPAELAPVADVATANLDAYREYQLGLEAYRGFQTIDARAHFETALELDPDFALAYLQLALTQFIDGDFSFGTQNMQRASATLTAGSERDRLFLDGMLAMMLRQDQATARVKLRELVEKYPDEKEGRAWLWRMSGDEERRQLLEDGLKLDPFNTMALNELAYDLAREGDYATADSLIATYVEVLPDEPNPRDSQGEIFEFAGKFDAARASYMKALELDPRFHLSLDHLVRTYLRQGRPEDARAALVPFTTDSVPGIRVEALLLTADTYTFEGDFEASRASIEGALAFTRALERTNLESRALVNWLIPLLLRTHQFEELEPAFERLREIDPVNPLPAVYGLETLGEAGRLDEMSELNDLIQRALASNPQTQRFLGVLAPTLDAIVDYYRGDPDAALATPGLDDSALGISQIGTPVYPKLRPLLATGNGKEALREAERMERHLSVGVFGLNRFDPLNYYVARYSQGRAHELLGDTAQAIEAYRTVSENWRESVDEVPFVADAAERLEALRTE